MALNALIPEGMVDTIRSTLPDEMVEELEGYMTGLQGDAFHAADLVADILRLHRGTATLFISQKLDSG